MEDDAKRELLVAYRQLLKPLIKILIRNGISFGEFADVAKGVYVDIASSEFKVPKRKMSQARVAILTGLTRKEVSRFFGKKDMLSQPNSNLNRVTRVLMGWHTDSDFNGPYGLPLELPFEAETHISFCELVHRYSGDMAARAMLDELLRINAVRETEEGWYKVLTRTYLTEDYGLDAIDYLGRSVKDFVETIDSNNIERDSNKRNFERRVVADDGIREEDLPRLRAYVKIRAQLLLEEIDNWLSQLEKPSKDSKKVVNTGIGIYHYINREEGPPNSDEN